jgi:hypothetical protein
MIKHIFFFTVENRPDLETVPTAFYIMAVIFVR